MKKILLMITLIVLIFSFASCGASMEKQLIGSWYDDSDRFLFTLYDDGSCKIDNIYGTGSWGIVNGNQLKLTDYYGQSDSVEFEIDKDKLIIKSGENEEVLTKKEI